MGHLVSPALLLTLRQSHYETRGYSLDRSRYTRLLNGNLNLVSSNRHCDSSNSSSRKSTIVYLNPPLPKQQQKSLMSKAVLIHFCFGILTPKPFLFHSFHINYCFVQIKQEKNGAREASEQKVKYKSSQREKTT